MAEDICPTCGEALITLRLLGIEDESFSRQGLTLIYGSLRFRLESGCGCGSSEIWKYSKEMSEGELRLVNVAILSSVRYVGHKPGPMTLKKRKWREVEKYLSSMLEQV